MQNIAYKKIDQFDFFLQLIYFAITLIAYERSKRCDKCQKVEVWKKLGHALRKIYLFLKPKHSAEIRSIEKNGQN